MKIASWNVNSLRVRLPHVTDWLAQAEPDVLCLQELKLNNDAFPSEELEAAGYHCAFNGQKTYNGVAILSKQQPEEVVLDIPNYEDEQKRVISATIDGIRVINVYVPNGQSLDSDKFVYKQAWLQQLTQYCKAQLAEHPRLVLLGDFNITPSDMDVHDPEKWRGKIHCSDHERLQLQTLMSTGLYDTFRHFNSTSAFSWWDYRNAGYQRNEGLRIDLILASRDLLTQAQSCEIDEIPRKWEKPSDHTPVVATFLP